MKRTIQFVICLAISLGAMWFVFWWSGMKLRELVDAIVQMNYWWTIPFMALTVLGMYFRAIRWHYLLKPSRCYAPNQLFPSLMIGFALNGLLPARAGEFARAYALKQSQRCPFALGFGTVVLERIFDGIVLLALFAITLRQVPAFDTIELFGYSITPEKMRDAINGLSLIMGVFLIIVILLLFPRIRDFFEAVITRLPLPHGFKGLLVEMFHSFSQGMNSLRDPRLIITCIFWTVIAWASVGLSLQVLYYGFADQVARVTESGEFVAMSFSQGMTICIIISIAVTIPSAPGYWGLYEAGGLLAFTVLALAPDSPVPVSFTLVLHFFQMLPIILIGIYYMSRQKLSFKEILQHQQMEQDSS